MSLAPLTVLLAVPLCAQTLLYTFPADSPTDGSAYWTPTLGAWAATASTTRR